MRGHSVDEVAKVDTGGWQDDGTEEINEDDKTHREATETTEVLEPNKLCQIVECRIDPAAALREQDTPCFGRSGEGVGIRDKFVRHRREVLRHEGGEVTIFAERQQILFVEGVDVAIRVFSDHFVADEERAPFVSSP